MKKHIYRVSGLTKKGGMKYWKIDLEPHSSVTHVFMRLSAF